MFDPKEMEKFFIAKNADGPAPDARQIVCAWKDGDTIGTQLEPESLIGKKIIGYEYVDNKSGKTLFLYVEKE
jgi:hypothetical protein